MKHQTKSVPCRSEYRVIMFQFKERAHAIGGSVSGDRFQAESLFMGALIVNAGPSLIWSQAVWLAVRYG
jgi:hypothetical protein